MNTNVTLEQRAEIAHRIAGLANKSLSAILHHFTVIVDIKRDAGYGNAQNIANDGVRVADAEAEAEAYMRELHNTLTFVHNLGLIDFKVYRTLLYATRVRLDRLERELRNINYGYELPTITSTRFAALRHYNFRSAVFAALLTEDEVTALENEAAAKREAEQLEARAYNRFSRLHVSQLRELINVAGLNVKSTTKSVLVKAMTAWALEHPDHFQRVQRCSSGPNGYHKIVAVVTETSTK